MKRKIFRTLSLLMFLTGVSAIMYGVYVFLHPQYSVSIKELDPPSPSLGSWQKDFICSRERPTPLFLNFYGDQSSERIIIMLGREKEFARIVIFHMTVGGTKNIERFAVMSDGNLKNLSNLNEREDLEYLGKFNFIKEEEVFFRSCVYRAFADKFAI